MKAIGLAVLCAWMLALPASAETVTLPGTSDSGAAESTPVKKPLQGRGCSFGSHDSSVTS